jgi:hypothetical protein
MSASKSKGEQKISESKFGAGSKARLQPTMPSVEVQGVENEGALSFASITVGLHVTIPAGAPDGPSGTAMLGVHSFSSAPPITFDIEKEVSMPAYLTIPKDELKDFVGAIMYINYTCAGEISDIFFINLTA